MVISKWLLRDWLFEVDQDPMTSLDIINSYLEELGRWWRYGGKRLMNEALFICLSTCV